ncbi:MAG: hypothetical protein H7332_19825 [Bdellovibrionales bacterium]|nr:hypothetical protein [Ramlibacter sp.]
MATTTKPAVKKPAPAKSAKLVKAVKTAPAGPTRAAAKTLASVVAPPVAKGNAKPAVKPAAKAAAQAPKPVKVKKPKQVRDSFTMPKTEYAVLDVLKVRASKMGNAVKKSELLRAGVKALAGMSDAAFADCLKSVPAIKTGRPKLAGN